MDFTSKIILIYGPTASGKSEFAVKLAKKIKGEIINADSMQVYKELKILSARPSKKDYKKIRHHLYGFQPVKKNYSSGEWLRAAKKKILDIKNRKNIPIIVGGTGLYFKTLTDGIVNIPKIPIQIREKIRKLNSSMGNKNFLKRLKKLDPEILNYVNPSDTQRLIRAYEVKLFTKKTLLKWFQETKSVFENKNFYKIYIDYPRDILVNKIRNRAQEMINKGAILEAKRFLNMKVSKKRTASKAIGLIEIQDFVDKKIKINEVIERISIKTRQYAKRQSTWGRNNMKDWNKINPEDLDKFLKKI